MRLPHARSGRMSLLGVPLLACAALLVSCGSLRGGTAGGAAGPTATLAITATATPDAARGTLNGDVVAGPTCPVERAEDPCPSRPVAARDVTIIAADGTVAARVTTDAKGHFSASLAPGAYTVRVAGDSGALGMRQVTPGHVVVSAGHDSYIKIALDTGIR